MGRGFILFILVPASHMFGGVQNLPTLPSGATATAIQLDAVGNIYVAGALNPNPQNPNAPADVFAAKLSPDGSQIIWATTLGGSADDRAMAMALGVDGSVYLTGNTASSDFPTTPGSMQPKKENSFGTQAFAAKLDPNGKLVYATYIGGPAEAAGLAITADSGGHAFLTGYTGTSGFPTVGGSLPPGDTTSTSLGYVLELNPTGSAAVLALLGYGGNQIATDAQGNIYAAGAPAPGPAPVTPGAFQSSIARANCATSSFFPIPCSYQHIAKIDPTATRLIYATYIAGQWDAVPAGIAVNADGSVILAGSARGADYPTTPAAYQSLYTADPQESFQPIANLTAPVTTGYVTKLNSDGTALVWSTYFGGSGTSGALPGGGFTVPLGDTINSMAIDANGDILVGGFSRSTDLPGLWNTAVVARPSPTGSGFVARLSADGGRISATQLVNNQVGGIAVRSDGTVVVANGGLATVSFPADGRVYAIADPADNARVVNVAPGQLLTLYGTNLAPATPASPFAGFPASFNGVTVTFNGILAPILYTSGIQINMQVPYEIAGQTQVTMQVSSQLAATPLSESYILGVVAIHPSVFLSATNFNGPVFGELACNGIVYSGVQALALNPDGSVNSCANPAPQGSAVNVFLNGLGATSPAMSTGAVSSTSQVAIAPAVAVNLPASNATASAISTVAAPGTISALAETTLQLTAGGSAASAQPVTIPLDVAGIRTREQGTVIWMKPAN